MPALAKPPTHLVGGSATLPVRRVSAIGQGARPRHLERRWRHGRQGTPSDVARQHLESSAGVPHRAGGTRPSSPCKSGGPRPAGAALPCGRRGPLPRRQNLPCTASPGARPRRLNRSHSGGVVPMCAPSPPGRRRTAEPGPPSSSCLTAGQVRRPQARPLHRLPCNPLSTSPAQRTACWAPRAPGGDGQPRWRRRHGVLGSSPGPPRRHRGPTPQRPVAGACL